MDFRSERMRVVDWLRQQLTGPPNSSENLQGIKPSDRYPCGQLYPVIEQEGLDPAEEEDEDDYHLLTEDDLSKNTVRDSGKRRRYVAPSAVGFSFYATGENPKFQVTFSASRYEQQGGRNEETGQYETVSYKRIALGGDEEALNFSSSSRVDVMRDPSSGAHLAGIDVQWRPFREGFLITISLFNKQTGLLTENKSEISEKILFEVNLNCFVESGSIGNYPRVDFSLLNEEDQELELQYKARQIYAVGHGAGVDWNLVDGRAREIYSDFVPVAEVPQVTADVAGESVSALSISYLSTLDVDKTAVIDQLDEFVKGYSIWVTEQVKSVENLTDGEKDAATRILRRMKTTVQRMKRGVRLIDADPIVAKSFALANLAMLNQMKKSDSIRDIVKKDQSYAWRPFQLAFILTTVESSINESDEFRDTVDLIWFPTGGGKTEAYLGLMALIIIYRRMTNTTSGGGTSILMRYTLRLLTAQQFRRAARLICALDLLRATFSELGNEQISIGLWVGSAISPNSFKESAELVAKIASGRKDLARGFALVECPWCEHPFGGVDNYLASPSDFRFRCTNPSCEYGGEANRTIPCNVVDAALYLRPPTLLVGTLDKFARLAWDERAGSFFGGEKCKPPELIIQDELHLIAGALGSVAGLYEAAIDAVLKERGCFPKYVASTATIRMAEEQVLRIYGRDLAVFPPPGISCDDSYFARTVDLSVRPGRLYLGYFAPQLDKQHAMAPLAAALLFAPEAVFTEGEQDRNALLEAWWTQVVYHGSLKGIGDSHNAFNIDVRERFSRFMLEYKEIERAKIYRNDPKVSQLTSVSSAEKNAETFARLELDRTKDESLDVVLATNMVSVGLDVSRLALMVINGQPLTTAEYIQASSRVGRGLVPGLVCVNFYRNSARNLSHYENFKPYHESFYRFVEPTSVTPFTYQARVRALHAALVIVIRHSCENMLGNKAAGDLDLSHSAVARAIETLKNRCVQGDPLRKNEICEHVDRLVGQWLAEAQRCTKQKVTLCYQVPDNEIGSRRLLCNHADRIQGLWPTLQSMRNVEDTAMLRPL